jgi:hypothetical protein
MRAMRTASQTYAAICERIQQDIAGSLKRLLETKHLYQAVDLDIDTGINELGAGVDDPKRNEPLLKFNAFQFFMQGWIPQDPSGRFSYDNKWCVFNIPFIKTFCTSCGRIEPFNPVHAEDVLEMRRGGIGSSAFPQGAKGQVVQHFVFTYLCQGCKLLPEVFLVRRVGTKLILSGRSPIEHVDVAKQIPAVPKQYVAGAIVAHQCGQTLAGLFLLRTAIEQWIRSLGANQEKADQALDWYMTTLPADFSSRFPSLRDVYGTLSDALHKADASVPIFDKAMADIERHFDARRLYEIKDPPAPGKT